MHDLINWMIPWILGYLFNDLYRWWKNRRGWHQCPISTCSFQFKLTGNSAWIREMNTKMMRDHILNTHN